MTDGQDRDLPARLWNRIHTAPRGPRHPYDRDKTQAARFILVWNGRHIGIGWLQTHPDQLSEWWDEGGDPIVPPPFYWMDLPPKPNELEVAIREASAHAGL